MMWASPCNGNPWLLFSRASLNQCQHEVEDQVAPKEPKCATEQNWQAGANKRIPDDSNILHYHNDNGNAYMKMASEPEARGAVDSDLSAHAELMDNVMEMNDQFSRPSLKQVSYSRSLGTLNRKLIVKPRGCRSLEVCSKHDDSFMEYNTSPECENIENFYALEEVKRAEAENDEWERFQINLEKSGPENKSNNERASVNTNMERSTNGKNIPKLEVSSERMVSPKKNHQNGTKEYEKNQWSPFRVVRNRSKSRLFSEYRQQEQDSPVSSESCFSINSGEAGYEPDVIVDIADSDSTEERYNEHDRVVDSDTKEESDDEQESDDENYEVIEWSKYTTGYIELENGMSIRDVCDTSSESPKLDLSGLEGYHTAPNSPDKCSDQYGDAQNTGDTEINLRPFQKQMNGNSTQHGKEKTQIRYTCERSDSTNLPQKTGTDCNSEGRFCNKRESSSALERFPNEVASALDTVYDYGVCDQNFNFQRINGRISTMNYRNFALDDPPFISVESIHYEADPTTGNCRVVGRGSFGKVYKARFSDPMYLHLPIVVKEFDEEFTNAKEILEEAKRLLYLQDTGYVPVCYGVLCFGSPQYQKYGIVQEYVGTGLTLEQMLWDETDLPLEYWFRIAIQSCEGLARFHEKGILLNDIKTNNILLEFGNNTVRIRYIDFGLATDLRGKRYKNTKSLEEFTYLAPEVRIGGQVTNLASDIYSLGYMLEQLYTHTSARDFAVVARLCMDVDPDMRLPVRRAASLLRERFGRFGFDPRSCDIV